MREYLLYVNGAFIAGGGGTMPATSPATGERFASVAVADPDDVDRAVVAARKAWVGWAAISPFERAACCESVMVAIGAHRDELARALSEDQGKPLRRGGLPGGRRASRVLPYGRRGRETPRRLAAAFYFRRRESSRFASPFGRRRGGLPVELALHDGSRAAGPRARGRQYRAVGASPDHLGVFRAPRGGDRRGWASPGGLQLPPRAGYRSWATHVVAHPGVDAVGFIGSVTTGRRVAERAGGKDPDTRARWQRPHGRVGGRRSRAGGGRHARGGVSLRRPKLHGR